TQSGHQVSLNDPHSNRYDDVSCALGEAMRRREFISLVGGATVAYPLAALAQQQAMSVVGLLTATNLSFDQFKSIQKGFDEGGYVEGRNLAIVHRLADSQYDRLPMLAAESGRPQSLCNPSNCRAGGACGQGSCR